MFFFVSVGFFDWGTGVFTVYTTDIPYMEYDEETVRN